MWYYQRRQYLSYLYEISYFLTYFKRLDSIFIFWHQINGWKINSESQCSCNQSFKKTYGQRIRLFLRFLNPKSDLSTFCTLCILEKRSSLSHITDVSVATDSTIRITRGFSRLCCVCSFFFFKACLNRVETANVFVVHPVIIFGQIRWFSPSPQQCWSM